MKNIKAFAKRNGFSYRELADEGKPIGILILTMKYDENGRNASIDFDKLNRVTRYCTRTDRRFECRYNNRAVAVYADKSYLKRIREKYPFGTVLELDYTDNVKAPPKGSRMFVVGLDSMGNLEGDWDNGSFNRIVLDPNCDRFHVVDTKAYEPKCNIK